MDNVSEKLYVLVMWPEIKIRLNRRKNKSCEEEITSQMQHFVAVEYSEPRITLQG